MKRAIAVAAFLAVTTGLPFASAQPQPDPAIWREFVRMLKTDALPLDRIHPDDLRTPESRLAWLKEFVKETDWTEWEAAPQVVRYGNLVSFITTLGQSRKSPWSYIFCFVVGDGRWSYRFTEGIFIRLDQISPLPADAAGFPDLPEEQKHWMRQEIYWSKNESSGAELLLDKTERKSGEAGLANFPPVGVGVDPIMPEHDLPLVGNVRSDPGDEMRAVD